MVLGLSRLAVLLLCFVVAVHGYISALDYYAAGELRASYQTPGGSNDIKGLFVIEYRAKSKRLNYKVAVNLISVGDVTINGPARCLNRANGGSFSQTDPNCIYNTGPVVFKLGTGIVPKDGEDATNQYFEGSRSLNSVEEAMLFNSELYILVNTILPDPETQKEVDTPILRGGITVRVQTDTSLVSILSFVNSPKDFDSSIQRVKTGNQGLGYLFYNADNTNLGVRIFTTMKQAGSYLLKCGGRSKVLASGQSQVATNVNFNEAADTPMLLESLVKGQCYVFITSAEAVDGDIFAWVEGVRTMENILVGTKMDPPTNSPYLAYASIYFDQGDKTLDILVRHNITEGVTGASVHTNGGAPLCDLMNNNNFPLRSFCRLNETHLEDLTRGRIYITLSTEANPNGEVRGPIVFNGKATTFSGSAGSSSLAIGLGVGLGVGIPVLILAIVGIVFLAKRGGSTGKI